MKHLSIRVRGRVQGVFFRASAKDMADKLLIRGFVRNEDDGSVYIEAEGEEDALKSFTEWCKKGPAHAHVEDVILAEGQLKNFVRFEIQR